MQDVAKETDMSIDSAYTLIHGVSGLLQCVTKWVPGQFTAEHHNKRLGCSLEHHMWYKKGWKQLLATWMHHFTLESKATTMEWKYAMSSVRKRSGGKVMLTVFKDGKGFLLIHYCETLNRLESVIHCKCPAPSVQVSFYSMTRPIYTQRDFPRPDPQQLPFVHCISLESQHFRNYMEVLGNCGPFLP